LDKLSARQRSIYDLLVIGHTTDEIVRDLGLSLGLTQIEIRRIYWRLGFRMDRKQIRKFYKDWRLFKK
jgi:DNA-binding NarL/FixJ family response regulator